MKHFRRVTLPAFAVLLLAAGADAQTGFPFQNESLHYTINWQSGLSLGDAAMSAHKTETGWGFEMTVSASVPGFPVSDKIRSSATADLCSVELDRDLSHGSRKSHEKTAFDQDKGKAHRKTVFPDGGGESDFDIPSCARDALAFVYYGRRELGQGRVPPQQQVFFGSGYSVRMEYTGAMNINVGEKSTVTDHLVVSVKGPKTDSSIEVFYARDAARTPLVVKVPCAVGTFSMELVR